MVAIRGRKEAQIPGIGSRVSKTRFNLSLLFTLRVRQLTIYVYMYIKCIYVYINIGVLRLLIIYLALLLFSFYLYLLSLDIFIFLSFILLHYLTSHFHKIQRAPTAFIFFFFYVTITTAYVGDYNSWIEGRDAADFDDEFVMFKNVWIAHDLTRTLLFSFALCVKMVYVYCICLFFVFIYMDVYVYVCKVCEFSLARRVCAMDETLTSRDLMSNFSFMDKLQVIYSHSLNASFMYGLIYWYYFSCLYIYMFIE